MLEICFYHISIWAACRPSLFYCILYYLLVTCAPLQTTIQYLSSQYLWHWTSPAPPPPNPQIIYTIMISADFDWENSNFHVVFLNCLKYNALIPKLKYKLTFFVIIMYALSGLCFQSDILAYVVRTLAWPSLHSGKSGVGLHMLHCRGELTLLQTMRHYSDTSFHYLSHI